MEPNSNFKKYRQKIRENLEQKKPSIPYMAILLRDIILCEEGNESLVDGQVNYEKMVLLGSQIKTILSHQKVKYNMNRQEEIYEKLSKITHYDEDSLYYKSTEFLPIQLRVRREEMIVSNPLFNSRALKTLQRSRPHSAMIRGSTETGFSLYNSGETNSLGSNSPYSASPADSPVKEHKELTSPKKSIVNLLKSPRYSDRKKLRGSDLNFGSTVKLTNLSSDSRNSSELAKLTESDYTHSSEEESGQEQTEEFADNATEISLVVVLATQAEEKLTILKSTTLTSFKKILREKFKLESSLFFKDEKSEIKRLKNSFIFNAFKLMPEEHRIFYTDRTHLFNKKSEFKLSRNSAMSVLSKDKIVKKRTSHGLPSDEGSNTNGAYSDLKPSVEAIRKIKNRYSTVRSTKKPSKTKMDDLFSKDL